MSPEKTIACTAMDAPLVCIFPNSTTLLFPGIWNNSPGVNSTNSTTATITGPQSAISKKERRNYKREMVGLLKRGWKYGVQRGGYVWWSIQKPSLHNVSVAPCILLVFFNGSDLPDMLVSVSYSNSYCFFVLNNILKNIYILFENLLE